MDDLLMSPFLASPAELQLALGDSSDFRNFLALAERSSGEPCTARNAAEARYRLLDPREAERGPLAISDTVRVGGLSVGIDSLITTSLNTDRTLLIHSLWQLDSFQSVKLWLKSMRALVRYVADEQGGMVGHLLLAETVIPMVETIERREYVLPNGDMASDAITRNLGVRAKVFALDRARRTPVDADDQRDSIMDRLSRTLAKSRSN